MSEGQEETSSAPTTRGRWGINTGNELGVIIKVVEGVALNMATTLESPISKDRGASLS